MTEQPARARDRGDGAVGAVRAAGLARAPARSDRAELLRILAWAVAFAGTAAWGYRTEFGGSGFALFWPASGIALAWIATSPARTRVLELALLGVLAGGSAYATGESGWEVLNAAVGVPLGMVAFVLLAPRLVPGLRGTGGDRPIETLRQYALLLAATIVAGAVEAGAATLLLAPDPGLPFERVGELAITHTVAMATVGLTLLIAAGWYAGLPRGRFPGNVLAGIRRDSTPRDLVIVAIALAVTVVVFLAGFLWFTDSPVSFVLVMLVAGAGIRFTPTSTGLYALAISVAACWLTAEGRGPIDAIAEPHRRALAFGLFMTALVVTGLIIALSRRERDEIIGRLRESERAAEVLADDLTLVLANLEEGVAVVEAGGRFIHANAAIGRLLHLPDFDDQQVAPVGTYHLVHPDGRPLLESEVPHVRVFNGEEEVHDTLHLARQDVAGEMIFEVSARLLPQIRSTDPPRAVTTIHDATAEHQQRDALTSFAQVVAHDLRSPLTSVELWARELLDSYQDGPVDAETATMMLGHVESAAGRMQNFISDLLAYAVARDQAPNPALVELTDVVETVVETIAAVEGVQPEVDYDDLGLWCDPVLLPQVFDNLIGNARKYVADGVVPQVRIEASPVSADWIRVRVMDNGIGIAPEDRGRVFETFERARATEYEGTGLGLAICRHIVERHGGTIGVTTPPGRPGTWIELTLPTTDRAFDGSTDRSADRVRPRPPD